MNKMVTDVWPASIIFHYLLQQQDPCCWPLLSYQTCKNYNINKVHEQEFIGKKKYNTKDNTVMRPYLRSDGICSTKRLLFCSRSKASSSIGSASMGCVVGKMHRFYIYLKYLKLNSEQRKVVSYKRRGRNFKPQK